MSKLFLLISFMISIITINVYADTSEQQDKANCLASSGGKYGDAYQNCLRRHAIFAVNRNLNSNDTSKSDSRVCYIGNDTCRMCMNKYGYVQNTSQARTGVVNCLAAEQKKVDDARNAKAEKERRDRQAEADRKRKAAEAAEAKRKRDAEQAGAKQLDEVKVVSVIHCEKRTPQACHTEEACSGVNGIWSGTACTKAQCPEGTTVDSQDSMVCHCNGDANYSLERGTSQQCPSACSAANNMEYNMVARSCICKAGYDDPTGMMLSCIARNTTPPTEQVSACLQELQTKVAACNTSATKADDKCGPQKKGGGTLDTIQSLMNGGAQIAGALDSCSTAAVAGSTGYYALEGMRGTCDTEISTCKSSCEEANSMLANKETIYQNCRHAAFETHQCSVRSPYRAGSLPSDEPAFNLEWDGVNRASFEQQVQQMQTTITDNNNKCEAGGSAVANRDGLSDAMDRMNTAYKSASQCECQLSAGGTNCNSIVGPADCAADPTLAGCTKASINCLSATDNSPKCLCFKDPNSDGCKNIRTVANTASNVSGFAAANANGAAAIASPFGASESASGKGVVNMAGTSFENDKINPIASGTEAVGANDSASTFGTAGGAGSGGGGAANFGSGGSNAKAGSDEDPEHKGIKGLLDTAKNAIGNLFKKGGDKNSSDENSYGQKKYDANGNPINSHAWRPRGMGRGVAGANEELGGKFEDIWKVMNKQYKVQDQKDNFIFGGEKN